MVEISIGVEIRFTEFQIVGMHLFFRENCRDASCEQVHEDSFKFNVSELKISNYRVRTLQSFNLEMGL